MAIDAVSSGLENEIVRVVDYRLVHLNKELDSRSQQQGEIINNLLKAFRQLAPVEEK